MIRKGTGVEAAKPRLLGGRRCRGSAFSEEISTTEGNWRDWVRALQFNEFCSLTPVCARGRTSFFCLLSVVLVPFRPRMGGEPPVGHHRRARSAQYVFFLWAQPTSGLQRPRAPLCRRCLLSRIPLLSDLPVHVKHCAAERRQARLSAGACKRPARTMAVDCPPQPLRRPQAPARSRIHFVLPRCVFALQYSPALAASSIPGIPTARAPLSRACAGRIRRVGPRASPASRDMPRTHSRL